MFLESSSDSRLLAVIFDNIEMSNSLIPSENDD